MAKKVGNTYFFTGKGKSSGGGGGGDATDAVKYTEQTLTESQQMQARKNQGLYYEEEGLVDKTITFDGDTPPSSDWKDTAFGIVNMDSPTSDLYIKVSDEVPPIDNWGEILNLNGQPKTEEFIEGNNYYLIGTDAYYPDVIVVENDNTTVDNIGVAPKRGIYVGYIVSTNRSMDRTNWELQSPYVSSISYEGTTTTVHQIPAKYVPQTIPVVRMEIPSNDNRVSYGIGYVLLNNYVSERDVVFSIEGKTIEQVAVRNMLDTTSTGDVWDFGTGNTYNFDTSGYYLVEIEVQETPSSSAYYYATVFVETVNM